MATSQETGEYYRAVRQARRRVGGIMALVVALLAYAAPVGTSILVEFLGVASWMIPWLFGLIGVISLVVIASVGMALQEYGQLKFRQGELSERIRISVDS